MMPPRGLQYVLACALVQPALGQIGAPPAVSIDVIVSDAQGRPIDDLASGDFELLVDGQSQTIDTVRLVNASGALEAGEASGPIESRADEESEAGREGTRLFGILLDEYHVSPGAAAERGRAAVRQFVEQHVGPRDLIVLVKPLDSLTSLRMTRDRTALLRSIAQFEGRKGDYAPRDTFERNFFAGNPARIEAMRAQVAVSALNALAIHMGQLNAARKAIIVVSEGVPPLQRRRGEGPLPTIDTVIRSANRSKVALYPFDPSGTTEAESRQTLKALADETAGLAAFTPDAFQQALTRVVRDSNTFYLLSLRSATDGRFHPVAVRVKRAGAVVRARKGFWAPSGEELSRASLAAPRPTPPPLLPRRASPLIRPWFGQARGDDGQTRVSFVWEPAARRPGQTARPSATPARIAFKALKGDGTALFEGVVRPAGNSMAGNAIAPARLVFHAPPGRLRIEMSIEDVQQRPIDTDVRDVTVVDFSGPIVLGTSEVLRARTAREFRALEAEPDAAPTASRDFSRAERLLIRVPAYGAGGAPPLVTARLLSRLGSAMRELAVAAGPRPDLHQVDLPLAGLATGEYIVELTAAVADRSSKDTVAFRIVP